MVSCNDCLHIDVCEIRTCYMCDGGGFKCDDCEIYSNYGGKIPSIKNCKHFKDRNRVVELPCKIGDKYYRVEKFCTEGGYLDEPKLVSGSDCEYCCEECNKEYRVVEYQFNSIIQILQKEYYIGKTVFLTQEEAERALKRSVKQNERRNL